MSREVAEQRRVRTMICTVGREHLDPEKDETEAGRKCPGDESLTFRDGHDVRPAIDGRCRALTGKMGQMDGPAPCSSSLPSYVTCDTALASGSGREDLARGDAVAVTTSFRAHCPLQEERLRRGDDLRLQMALEESRRDTVKVPRKK
ncbi:hypothetical protein E2I00_017966, partial [Balaenoptera physalus]